MITTKTFREKIAYVFIHFTLAAFSIACILPLILTFIVSISSEESITLHGYKFIPSSFSLAAYKLLFNGDQIYRAYGITIFVTIVGSILSVIFTGMAAYAISIQKVKYRNKFALFFYLPMIFSAGLVPWYLTCTKFLMLRGHISALILPILIQPFNMFLMRNYFKSIPPSITESAEIDGSTPFKTFIKIIIPISTPIIATVGLFVALSYWNDWYLALWFIDDSKLFPLQFLLYRIQSLISFMQSGAAGAGNIKALPTETVQVATLFVTIGPIVLIYPFVQKYFIKGIMVGSVKG